MSASVFIPSQAILSEWVQWIGTLAFCAFIWFRQRTTNGVNVIPSIPLLTALQKTQSEIDEIRHSGLGLPQNVGHFFHSGLASSCDET